ncbi:MAG: TIGR01212 family radical SAM protein [Clostridium sp.]|nr:TIGR01212 family radical SAM protein [Clostridium sp.]MCM1444252.1 TIGR01212 family radical SAM protein [Candidatus Amulumruptor caecigallinarius]
MFIYSDNNKRYHTLDYFYKNKFNSKVFKISLDAGFTCPNIDGRVGTKGCIYCSKKGSGDFAGNKNESLTMQFEKIKNMMLKKWPNGKYIGYFQAHTNTYASVDVLKEKYEEILKIDNVIGLNIATRADAIDSECLQYLNELNKKTFLTIELGLQTIHDKTSNLINRCHSLKTFTDMVNLLRKNNINVVVHIINGLPYETKEMMIETVKYINNLDIQGVKIHMLHILKNTELEKLYSNEKFHILTKEEYVDIVATQLLYLRPEIVIHRITGDPDKNELIEPIWLLKKFCVLNDIDKKMKELDIYQGEKAISLN